MCTSSGSLCFQTKVLDQGIHFGQIRYCKLDGVKNSDLHKTRPVIIVQRDCDTGNKIAVIPLTSEPDVVSDESGSLLALEMNYVYRANKVSYVHPEGLIFVDRSRIDCYIGDCPEELLLALEQYFENKLF